MYTPCRNEPTDADRVAELEGIKGRALTDAESIELEILIARRGRVRMSHGAGREAARHGWRPHRLDGHWTWRK
jgi:hypothetical protein